MAATGQVHPGPEARRRRRLREGPATTDLTRLRQRRVRVRRRSNGRSSVRQMPGRKEEEANHPLLLLRLVAVPSLRFRPSRPLRSWWPPSQSGRRLACPML